MAVHVQSAGRIAAVDGLRGLAAIGIICLHTWYGSGSPWPTESSAGMFAMTMVAAGFVCVDFFFVISGFVLFLPTCLNQGEFGPLRPYAIRRVARIVPLYWASLVVLVLALPLLTTEPSAFERRAENLALHLPFLQHSVGLALDLPEGFVVNGVVWTLTLEVLYYAMLPLVAAAFFRRPALWTALFVAVSLAWRYWVTTVVDATSAEDPSRLSFILIAQIPTYLPHFALGMAAAVIYARVRDRMNGRTQRVGTALMATGSLGILWSSHELGVDELMKTASPYSHHTATMVVVVGFTMVLLGVVLAHPWAQRTIDNPVVRKLGDISYGLYLWHCLVIGFCVTTLQLPLGGAGAFVAKLAVVLTATIALAWISHVTIERPAIEWARRRTAARRATGPRDETRQLA